METTVPILIGLGALLLLGLGAVLDDRRARLRRRDARDERTLALPLLHSINDDRCIGCEACVDACPTEVLDLVDHKVRVARFSDCVQCEQCAHACPTQALVMYRAGTTPRMLTVPEIDEQFQTGVPGQYLIGEVAGKPLVKNAANLGRAVIEHIARDLAGKPSAPGVLDVAIVGSGPGGLSAGLACIKHKLSCLVLEKEHVIASTVARYPKGKHFMAEPCSAKNVSYLPVFDGTKEQLVAAWTQLVTAVQLPIQLGEAVETVQRGDDGVFAVKTTVGSYRARAVVLATGLRGKPRLLAVPGANLEKVQSLLDDPAEFAGEHVLVVGGGDSAVEGAIALAEAGATVALSYRGDSFKRCKPGNQKRLAEMAGQRLTVLLESNVTCFTPDAVTIACKDRELTLPNQRAFVLIGADTPIAWLEANQVRFVERPHLYALGSTEDVVRRFAPDAAACPHAPEDALAVLLDRPAPRQPVRRMRTVAQHLREELREVVTSVSGAFRLSDLPVEPESAHEPLGPRAHRRAATSTGAPSALRAQRATEVVPSLRAREAAAGQSGAPPSHARTDEMAALRRALDDTTDEMASLRVRERHAEQIAALRGGDDPTRVTAIAAPGQGFRSPTMTETVTVATVLPPDELPTDEVLSLRALDQTAIDLPALRVRDGAAPPRRPRERTDVVAVGTIQTARDASPSRAAPGRPRRPSDSVVTSAPRPASAAAVGPQPPDSAAPRPRRSSPPPLPASARARTRLAR